MKLGQQAPPAMAAPRMRLLPPYIFGQINALRDVLNAQGKDVVDLGMGNPTDAAPRVAIEALKAALERPHIHRYSAAKGIPALREAACRYYKRWYGVELDAESEIVALVGSKEGIGHFFLTAVGPQDIVLVPTPAFPVHFYGPQLAGGVTMSVPLLSLGDEGVLARVEELCRTLTPKPKILVLCFPHNPTGHTVAPWFYERAVALARRYGCYIVSDLAYSQTVFDGYRAPAVLQVPGAKEVAIEFFTLSKPYNMPGWRVGFAAGNRDLVGLLAAIKGYYDYGLFAAIEQAAAAVLDNCDEVVGKQALIYQERRDILCDGLSRMGFRFERPRGGMFVWARLPEGFADMPTMEFAERLMREAYVAVAPGSGFGTDGEGALRLAIVEPKERVAEAIRRLEAWMKKQG